MRSAHLRSVACCASWTIRCTSTASNSKLGRITPIATSQFAHIDEQIAIFTAAGQPIISVDSKKKLRHEVARSEWTRR